MKYFTKKIYERLRKKESKQDPIINRDHKSVAQALDDEVILAQAADIIEHKLTTKDVFYNISHAYIYLCFQFSKIDEKKLICLAINEKHHLVSCNPFLIEEKLDPHPIPYFSIRKIVQYAMKEDASAIILAHNFLTDKGEIGIAMIENTQKLCDVLVPIHIMLWDHVVIPGNDFISMRKRGII